MTVDELIKTVILGAPNLAVAIMALWWARAIIERMLTRQETLIDQLLEKCEEVSVLKKELWEHVEKS